MLKSKWGQLRELNTSEVLVGWPRRHAPALGRPAAGGGGWSRRMLLLLLDAARCGRRISVLLLAPASPMPLHTRLPPTHATPPPCFPQVAVYVGFAAELYAWMCIGEIIGRGGSLTGYNV